MERGLQYRETVPTGAALLEQVDSLPWIMPPDMLPRWIVMTATSGKKSTGGSLPSPS